MIFSSDQDQRSILIFYQGFGFYWKIDIVTVRHFEMCCPIGLRSSTLTFICSCGAQLNPDSGPHPQRVVEASDRRFRIVRVLHVHKGELFQNITFDDFAKLLKELLEFGVASRLRYIADIDFDRLAHFAVLVAKRIQTYRFCDSRTIQQYSIPVNV